MSNASADRPLYVKEGSKGTSQCTSNAIINDHHYWPRNKTSVQCNFYCVASKKTETILVRYSPHKYHAEAEMILRDH